ncbi:MAG: sugar phosphate isomerase/epimerase [Treponema sp.]|nr:sugar phosphate isomerase/epimerase [Treponema sp.]
MKKLKAAWIGFRQEGDPWEIYESRAKIGFKGMDGDLSRMEGDPAENLKRFKALGLEPLCTFSGRGDWFEIANNKEGIKEIVKRANFYGINKVNIPMSSCIKSFGTFAGDVGTYDEMMYDIDGMNALVKALADEGLVPIYHNHFQEYTTHFKGVSIMDYFLTDVDPRFMLKLDVGWVYCGNLDPVEYMEKAKDRIALLHLKDFTSAEVGRQLVNADKETFFGFTALGTGALDLPGILKKAIEIGQEWAIVEQDRTRNLNWEDALHCSYLNMKETGYVE